MNSTDYGDTIRNLQLGGGFATLESRLPLGGSLQARRMANGEVSLYWRYTQGSTSPREPIGLFDPKAPPKKLEPTARGYGIAAALRRCEQLAKLQAEWADRGGLKAMEAASKAAVVATKAAETAKASRTLAALLETYIAHLKAQGRRSWRDAQSIFETHVSKAWPDVSSMPAADVTPDHVTDMRRRLIEAKKGRTANKLRSYIRAAYQCGIDARVDADIPVAFKAFNIVNNPAASTKRSKQFDRADKNPVNAAELKAYWRKLKDVTGPIGATLRLHVLTGGQRIEQFVRLQWPNVTDDSITIHDLKGRPGIGARPHILPLLDEAAKDLKAIKQAGLSTEGPFVFTTTDGKKPINATTLAGWARDAVGDDIEGFQLKRVRSGIETLLASRDVSRDHRGQLQSHGQHGVQQRHYDGHDYLPQKRAALELLLAELESKEGTNVTPIRRSATVA